MTVSSAKVGSCGAFLACRIPANTAFFLFVILALVLGSCGSTISVKKSEPVILKVVSAPAQGNLEKFNPYFDSNSGSTYGTQGFVYETLYFVNRYNGQETPWLASGYEYSKDLTSLTFHLHSGIKWSDGKPFTSADVMFTFDLMKQHPTIDTGSVWSHLLKDVVAPDSSTVTFILQQPDTTTVWRLGGQVFIVPQHIWQNVSGDPATFTNPTPVGTGPFTLASYAPKLIKYIKNTNYWGTKPAIDQIWVPYLDTNINGALQMARGQVDWMGAGWTPDLDPVFANKDPVHNHHWFAPSNTVMLYLNLQKYPFNLLAVRKAISLTIDRPALQQKAAPYAPPANPTGILQPNFKKYISHEDVSAQFTVNRSQAESLLQGAGFKKDSSGIYANRSGKEISFSLIDVNGWSDWDGDTELIQQNLQQIGIKTTINRVASYNPFYSALSTGAFDAGICWTDDGPTPYYSYFDMLASARSAPPGQSVTGTNFERWSDHTTDQLLKQYSTSRDPAMQLQAIQGLGKIMIEQLPAIPLAYNPYWAEYTTTNLQGWPDASNPYDIAAPYKAPDNENVVLHLHPAA